MLKLEKKKEIVNIYGNEVEISLPTVKQLREFAEKSKQEGFDDFSGAVEMLVQAGVPSELVNELSPGDFKSLVEFVLDVKKK